MKQVGETEIGVVLRSSEVHYHCYLKYPAEIKLKDAEELHLLLEELTGHENHVMVFDLALLVGMEREAREFLIKTQEKDPNVIAVGLVTNSPISRLIGKLFLTLNRPPFPIKLFKDVGEADEWVIRKLQQFQLLA